MTSARRLKFEDLRISVDDRTVVQNSWAFVYRLGIFSYMFLGCCFSFFITWQVAKLGSTSTAVLSVVFASVLLALTWVAIAIAIRIPVQRQLPVSFGVASLPDDELLSRETHETYGASVMIATNLRVVELFIDRDFATFRKADAKGIVDAIRKSLDIDSIRILGYAPGSVRLALSMEGHYAERLYFSARAGDLSAFDVSDAKVYEPEEWRPRAVPRAKSIERQSVAQSLYPQIKRVLDLILSLALLVILSPLFLIIAILVKLSSPGPVLFTSTRIGKDCKPIRIYKFRTMVVKADSVLKKQLELHVDMATFKLKHDPRVTVLGRILRKTSLDELPQLVNVLTGEMSLVGPRPLQYFESESLPDDLRTLRQSVQPGLTCTWQLSSRNAFSVSEGVAMDIGYVRQRSFWMDLKILLQTVRVVLITRNFNAAV